MIGTEQTLFIYLGACIRVRAPVRKRGHERVRAERVGGYVGRVLRGKGEVM